MFHFTLQHYNIWNPTFTSQLSSLAPEFSVMAKVEHYKRFSHSCISQWYSILIIVFEYSKQDTYKCEYALSTAYIFYIRERSIPGTKKTHNQMLI